jgi:AcrR family transcriptional regulator
MVPAGRDTQPLTRERIVSAAEEALRRFGPGKTTVVDVARALGVSHGTVYRHFASKADLRDAVLEQWLERIHPPLAEITAEPGPAAQRLCRWLRALMEHKREQAVQDPDLFAAYALLAAESRSVIATHVSELTGQIERILAQGAGEGEFAVPDPAAGARAVFAATVCFHHPAHAAYWDEPGVDEEFDDVCSLLLNGLTGR